MSRQRREQAGPCRLSCGSRQQCSHARVGFLGQVKLTRDLISCFSGWWYVCLATPSTSPIAHTSANHTKTLPHSVHFHGHNSLVLAGSKDPYSHDLVLKRDNSPSTRASSTTLLLASQSPLLWGDQRRHHHGQHNACGKQGVMVSR
jgi:hypothetical protein